jgi:cobalamin-dependent methionine synthase I
MMRTIIQIPASEAVPAVGAILEAQGIPRFRQNDERTRTLALKAIEIYRERAKPTGIVMEVTKEEFAFVFQGEGRNESESPVRPISEASDQCALYAVTIGEDLCAEISQRFLSRDFALGSMLDAAASEGTEMTAQALENIYRRYLNENHSIGPRDGTLRFSPGYCGWHVSGQKKLFSLLQPDEIDISLNDSCLMKPLKSISGVIIVGKKDIFAIDDTFSFCRNCVDHTCQERIQALMNQ